MGIVALFIDSKMPALLADMILDNMPDVLMVAPVAIDISRKLKISPVKPIIAIAISSNLQGAATLVGDTTSILLGSHANMNFLDFFFYHNRPGMFLVVQLGAILSALVLLYVFRKQRQPISVGDWTVVKDYFPTVILVSTVILLILASFLPNKPQNTNGYICVGLFLVGLVREVFKKRFSFIKNTIKDIDYFTLLLLAGLFIVIAGITEAGVIKEVSRIFVSISNNNVFAMYSLLVWASVLLSAFIDNIPYVATMLPVTAGIAEIMGVDPTVLYFGLLAGATLGGNLTPIGASANIAGLGILRKEGYEVKAHEFMKISVPFTLAAVLSGYILIWLFWGI
jgi:Na+/H+ antiporter NhaD/arsenite permease-like protein